MEILSNNIVTGVAVAVTAPLLIAAAVLAKSLIQNWLDRRKVFEWLRSNSQDEPGESHVDTATIAKGSKRTEARTRRACMSDKRILRFADGEQESWSVWREEPQSIYEKRGITII